jgi:5-deoxy-D-glucuronate isomerase
MNLNPKATPSIEGIIRWIRDTSVKFDALSRQVTFDTESVSSDFTTTRSTYVVATSSITVTLNASPADQEEVIVKRVTAAGNVTVSGNGNNIDGSSSSTLSANYDSITVRYFDSEGQWLTI